MRELCTEEHVAVVSEETCGAQDFDGTLDDVLGVSGVRTEAVRPVQAQDSMGEIRELVEGPCVVSDIERVLKNLLAAMFGEDVPDDVLLELVADLSEEQEREYLKGTSLSDTSLVTPEGRLCVHDGVLRIEDVLV